MEDALKKFSEKEIIDLKNVFFYIVETLIILRILLIKKLMT